MNGWNIVAFVSLAGFFASMLIRAPIEIVLISATISGILFLIAALKGA